jgi:hypothetical protein
MSNITVESEIQARHFNDTQMKDQDEKTWENSFNMPGDDLSATVKTRFGKGLVGELKFMAGKGLTHFKQLDITDMPFQWQLLKLFRRVKQKIQKTSLLLYTEY